MTGDNSKRQRLWARFRKHLKRVLSLRNQAGGDRSVPSGSQARSLVVHIEAGYPAATVMGQVKQMVLIDKWTIPAPGLEIVSDSPALRPRQFAVTYHCIGGKGVENLAHLLSQIDGVSAVERASL